MNPKRYSRPKGQCCHPLCPARSRASATKMQLLMLVEYVQLFLLLVTAIGYSCCLNPYVKFGFQHCSTTAGDSNHQTHFHTRSISSWRLVSASHLLHFEPRRTDLVAFVAEWNSLSWNSYTQLFVMCLQIDWELPLWSGAYLKICYLTAFMLFVHNISYLNS